MPALPPVIEFRALLLRPVQPARAAWCFVVLPQPASKRLPSRGMVSVTGTVDGHAFKATLSPDGQGSHWLKVPRALCQAAGMEAGDAVALEVTPVGKEPEPKVPPDLRRALSAAPEAMSQWKTITASARRDFIQWLGAAKQPETRVRRIRNACEMLAAGKRRICCFDRSGMYDKSAAAPQAAPAQNASRE